MTQQQTRVREQNIWPSEPTRAAEPGNGQSTSPPPSANESSPQGHDSRIPHPDARYCALCDGRDPAEPPPDLQAPAWNWLCQAHAVAALYAAGMMQRTARYADVKDLLENHRWVTICETGEMHWDDLGRPGDQGRIIRVRSLDDCKIEVPPDPEPQTPADSPPSDAPTSEVHADSELDAPLSPTGPTGEGAEKTPGLRRGRWQRTVARLRSTLGLTTGAPRAH